MSTELAPRQNNGLLPSRDDWQTMMQMADAFCKSGLIPTTIKTPQAALLIIQKGAELGLKPTYALSNIAVVQGKPVVGAEVMLNLVYRDHGDNAIRFSETTAKVCTIEYRRRAWKDPERYSFSIEDARAAGLTGKDNWKHYPAAMLRARCISAVARMAFPDSIAGMYTPEELGVDEHMDDQGDTILSVSEERRTLEIEPVAIPEQRDVIDGEVTGSETRPLPEGPYTDGGTHIPELTETLRDRLLTAACEYVEREGKGRPDKAIIVEVAGELGIRYRSVEKLSTTEMSELLRGIKEKEHAIVRI